MSKLAMYRIPLEDLLKVFQYEKTRVSHDLDLDATPLMPLDAVLVSATYDPVLRALCIVMQSESYEYEAPPGTYPWLLPTPKLNVLDWTLEE